MARAGKRAAAVERRQIAAFLFLPEEHDPDSYIRAYGKAQFEDALLNQSKPLSEYFWEHLSDGIHLNTQEGKAELAKPVRRFGADYRTGIGLFVKTTA